MNKYDVIVIGAGHAGCEAAYASARMGSKTLLLTTNLDTIGWIACSPSFGGPGRGQLVRELDALGGLMPRIIDKTAIHFRHSGKESTQWAPFAICDRHKYHQTLKRKLENVGNLYIKQDTVDSVAQKRSTWRAVTATGQIFEAKSLVITVGTFLKGRTLQGGNKQKAGRNNEVSAEALAGTLKGLTFKVGIFKTGTGPTVVINTDGFKEMERQFPDKEPRFFSFQTKKLEIKQVKTYKAFTNARIHKLLANKRMTTKGKSSRYCPSLLEKVNRFPEKSNHPVFWQPESLSAKEWFLNGFSMDFSESEQQELVNMINGLESAQIVRPGYSVAYYYLKSGQLEKTLESKRHKGLFFAGQLIGSSGYEEAASSGIIAGINAALKTKNKKPLVLSRGDAYIGVLVDDLTSKNIIEPYRMLTARAEFSLLLRSDNADLRLTPVAYELGLVDGERLSLVEEKAKIIKKALGSNRLPKSISSDIKREILIEQKYQPHLKQQLESRNQLSVQPKKRQQR